MKSGSCLCGAVRYEIDGDLTGQTFCHCSACRKASGSAFVAAAVVKTRDVRFVAGEDMLRAFASSPGKERVFCSRCGSPILSRRDAAPETVRLRLGTLDTPASSRPIAHIYASEPVDWYGITDDLPRYPAFEPGRTS